MTKKRIPKQKLLILREGHSMSVDDIKNMTNATSVTAINQLPTEFRNLLTSLIEDVSTAIGTWKSPLELYVVEGNELTTLMLRLNGNLEDYLVASLKYTHETYDDIHKRAKLVSLANQASTCYNDLAYLVNHMQDQADVIDDDDVMSVPHSGFEEIRKYLCSKALANHRRSLKMRWKIHW